MPLTTFMPPGKWKEGESRRHQARLIPSICMKINGKGNVPLVPAGIK
jgi:hypothetical protein